MANVPLVKAAAEEDLTCYQGSNFYDHYYILDSSGVAISNVGWKARMKAWPKGSPLGATASLALDETSGITLAGVSGEVTFKSTLAQTRAMPPGDYDYQQEFEDAAGNVQTYKKGVLAVNMEIA